MCVLPTCNCLFCFSLFPQFSSWRPWWFAGFPTRFAVSWQLPFPRLPGLSPTSKATSDFTLLLTPSSTSAPFSTRFFITCPPSSSGMCLFRCCGATSQSNTSISGPWRATRLNLDAHCDPCCSSPCVEAGWATPTMQKRTHSSTVTPEWLQTLIRWIQVWKQKQLNWRIKGWDTTSYMPWWPRCSSST